MDLQVESAQIDQQLLADSGDAQTTLTYDDVLNENYRKFDQSGRLVVGGFPLTSYWGMDYRKITDLKVRQALAYAYPYKDAYLAAGDIEGVTAIPGDTLMPPGTAGRVEFNPIPDHEIGSTDPEAAKALLEEAGASGLRDQVPVRQGRPAGRQGQGRRRGRPRRGRVQAQPGADHHGRPLHPARRPRR